MARLLLCSLTIVALAAGCRFGPDPDCVYRCHCMDGTVCNSSTGLCSVGCDAGGPDGYMWTGAWGGPGCQVGNVAYDRPATGANLNGWSTPPTRAVDGDRDPNYRFTDGACAYLRADYWWNLYWRVDLGSSYVIYNITVYGTDGTHVESNHWTSRVVEVGDGGDLYTECGDLGDNNNALQVDVVCPQPLVGRYVRIRASRYDARHVAPRLYLCEVFVIGYLYKDCTNGAFGPGCLMDCHCHDQCDVISGNCSSQCEDGWAGSDCQRTLLTFVTTLTILEITQNYLEFVFLASNSKDMPLSYVVEIRREGTEDWEELRVLSGTESGNITVNLQYDFQVSATYYVRVIPIFVYNGVHYRGHGAQATFIAQTPPAIVQTPPVTEPFNGEKGQNTAAVIGSVVTVVLVAALVVAVIVLIRLKPSCLQKFSEQHTTGNSNPNDVYYDITTEEHSNAIDIKDLVPYVRSAKSSTSGFYQEYTDVIRSASQQSGAPLYEPLRDADGNEDLSLFFQAYGSNRNRYMFLKAGTVDSSSVWRLAWQTRVKHIIAFDDNYTVAFADPSPSTINSMEITMTHEEQFADYIIRHFTVMKEGISQSVQLYLFLDWEEGTTPPNAAALIDFRRKLRQDEERPETEIVICSDRMDRAATFIAIDYLLQQAKAEDKVDVTRYFTHLFRSSEGMNISQEQYTFVYDAILEHISTEGTATSVHQFGVDGRNVSKNYKEMFQKLDSLRKDSFPHHLMEEGKHHPTRNRSSDIIPVDPLRVVLQTAAKKEEKYINAVFVNNYRTRHAFISTQAPMTATIGDIWRLVYDTGAKAIIMLNEIRLEDDLSPYWPTSKGMSFTTNGVKVSLSTELTSGNNSDSAVFVVECDGQEPFEVKQFQVKGWLDTDDTPRSTAGLLCVLEEAQAWVRGHGAGPIIVHCRDGVRKTGILCSAAFIFDSLKTEQEVDIFHAIRRVQASRPQFIHSEHQLEFLHLLTRDFILTNQQYEN